MAEHVQTDERVVTTTTVPAATIEDGSLVLVNDGVPTQVANPSRATVRTIVQSVVGILVVLVPLFNVVLANVISYLQVQTEIEVGAEVFVYLNAALAITAFVIGLVARIMATPGVNEWIKAHLPSLAAIPVR